jgi:hypothetical protein
MSICHKPGVAAGTLTLAAALSMAVALAVPSIAQAGPTASSRTADALEPALVRVASQVTGPRANRVRQDRRQQSRRGAAAPAPRRLAAQSRAARPSRAAVPAPIDLPPPPLRIIDTTGVGSTDVQSELP